MYLVILPGWGQDSEIWKDITRNFSNKVIVLDLPGFGNEILISPDWTIPDYAAWVKKRLPKGQFILFGHSFGGRIAAQLAGSNLSQLKGLILSGSPCIYRPDKTIKIKNTVNHSLKRLLPIGVTDQLLPPHLKQARQWGMESIFRKAVSYDQADDLKRINVPTLLIWGDKDTEVPLRIAREMQTLIKYSDLQIIDNAGHNSFLDNPYLFSGYVKKYIQTL